MSPVSRDRKSKESKTASSPRDAAWRRGYGPLTGQPRSAFTVMQSLLGPPKRPAWFDFSNKAALDRAEVVMAARGPRELEQATAELLGAELHRVLHEEREGMWFSWWFEELTDAAMARIQEEAGSRGGTWEPRGDCCTGSPRSGHRALQSRAQSVGPRDDGVPVRARR